MQYNVSEHVSIEIIKNKRKEKKRKRKKMANM